MKKKKKINLLLFILSLIAFFMLFGSTTKVNASITMQVKKNVEKVDVRASASKKSSLLGTLKGADTVEVDIINKKLGWVRIDESNCIRDSKSGSYKAMPQQYGYCQLTDLEIVQLTQYQAYSAINVYSRTDSSSTLLKTIKNLSIVKVVSTTKKWAKLSTGGYCLRTDLVKIEGERLFLFGTPLLPIHSYPYVTEKNIKEFCDGTKAIYATDSVLIKNANGSSTKWVRLSNGYYGVKQNLLNNDELKIAQEFSADIERMIENNNM